jgi:hypothetical protein
MIKFFRVAYWIGIFGQYWSVFSWYLPNRYRRKTRSVLHSIVGTINTYLCCFYPYERVREHKPWHQEHHLNHGKLIQQSNKTPQKRPSMVWLVKGLLLESLVRGSNPQVSDCFWNPWWGLRPHMAHHRPLGPRFWEGTYHSSLNGIA